MGSRAIRGGGLVMNYTQIIEAYGQALVTLRSAKQSHEAALKNLHQTKEVARVL